MKQTFLVTVIYYHIKHIFSSVLHNFHTLGRNLVNSFRYSLPIKRPYNYILFIYSLFRVISSKSRSPKVRPLQIIFSMLHINLILVLSLNILALLLLFLLSFHVQDILLYHLAELLVYLLLSLLCLQNYLLVGRFFPMFL